MYPEVAGVCAGAGASAWEQYWQEAIVESANGSSVVAIELLYIFQIMCLTIAVFAWWLYVQGSSYFHN